MCVPDKLNIMRKFFQKPRYVIPMIYLLLVVFTAIIAFSGHDIILKSCTFAGCPTLFQLIFFLIAMIPITIISDLWLVLYNFVPVNIDGLIWSIPLVPIIISVIITTVGFYFLGRGIEWLIIKIKSKIVFNSPQIR